MFSPYVAQIPIPQIESAEKIKIFKRVEAILQNSVTPKLQNLEADLDELIFDLYELTDTERQLIRDQTQARQGCDRNADDEEPD